MHYQRNALGEAITQWLAEHPTYRVWDFVVTQSSDASFHCLAISVFYRDLSDTSRGEVGAVR